MDQEVPRISSDPALASTVRGLARRSLMLDFENAEIDAAPPSPCRSAGRAQRSSSYLGEDLRAKPAALSRSCTSLPYVRFPLHPHNAAPVPPLPSSPGLSDVARRGDAAQSRVVRNPQRHLRPSPRGAGLLASPRPRSGSHNSDSNSSGSSSPAPSRPVSPSPLSPMVLSSPRPQDLATAAARIASQTLQPIINQDTMDGMSDVQSLEEHASHLSLERSLSHEGSQLERSASADPVMLESHLTQSGSAVENRRKRELASLTDRARLSQSTSNLPDLRALEFGVDHYPSALPRVASSSQPDLWLVSPETVNDLINGKFRHVCENYYLIDCRFPYEYNGGHIRGAINLANKDLVHDQFMNKEQRNTIIIFYCEFSSQRGPGSYRHLRACDRSLNKLRYPTVWYPQTYVLEGGYKAFWEAYPNSCDPRCYIPMLDERYKDELRQCQMQTTRMRSKSVSCIEITHSTAVANAVPVDFLLRGSYSQQ